MIIYYILFAILIVFAILDDNLTIKSKRQLLVLTGFILVLFAGLRSMNVDKDYNSYSRLFDLSPSPFKIIFDPINTLIKSKNEPTLTLIFSIIKSIFSKGFPIVIFIYALLSVTLKLKALKLMTNNIMLSILIYFSSIYILQDMTQIRAAVASGLFLLSIPQIINQNSKKFFLIIFLAICFHYSAIIFLPFYFFNTHKINKILFVFILVIPLTLALFKYNPFNFLTQFDFGIYTFKIKAYLIGQAWEKRPINIFNFSILFQIGICVFFVLFCEKLNNKFVVILTKINCFGVALFYIFSYSPVLAFRISDMLGIVQIILVPYLIYFIKPRALAEGVVILISFALFINQLVIHPILNPYELVFFK